MTDIPLKEIVLVLYGGLFGFALGKLPIQWVYLVLCTAILLTIVVAL